MARIAALVGVTVLAATLNVDGHGRGGQAAGTSVEVYLRSDFDSPDSPFSADGNAELTLERDPVLALSGGSLAIGRRQAGGYFGAKVSDLQIDDAAGLRIAFSVRTRGMRSVAVNLFDGAREDNTTPASPARTIDDEWRTVVFFAEDFHYNSDQPDRKVRGGRFASLMFHGIEEGDAPRVWIDRLVVYRGPDVTPPGPPTDLVATPAKDGQVSLRWNEPADDAFAAAYSIHRQVGDAPWQKVGESLRPSYRDGVPAAGTYRYLVTAADYENNVSAPSAIADVATNAGAAPEETAPVVDDRLLYAEHIREVHRSGESRVRPGVFLFAGDSITGAAVYTHVLGSWIARGQTIRQGVASVTASYGAANIGEYLRNGRPEFAVVMYGTNDSKGGRDVRNAMGELARVIDACVEAGTVPIVATIPPRGYSRRQGDQERFNEALIALAREKRVPVSYVFEEMMQHDLDDILGDGVHLTPDRGNDVAGRALRRTMDQVYFALRDQPR